MGGVSTIDRMIVAYFHDLPKFKTINPGGSCVVPYISIYLLSIDGGSRVLESIQILI